MCKKKMFFYHALNHSFCRVARRIAPNPRRKLCGKNLKKAESFILEKQCGLVWLDWTKI